MSKSSLQNALLQILSLGHVAHTCILLKSSNRWTLTSFSKPSIKASYSLLSLCTFLHSDWRNLLQVTKLLESRVTESQAESKAFLKQLQDNAVKVQAANAAWEESEAARAVMTQVFHVC